MAKKTSKVIEVPKVKKIEALPVSAEKTEKEKLLELYAVLKELNINSLGDLEVKISRLK